MSEIDLSDKEKTFYSESGEDGILFEIFKIFGVTNKFYVEFGAEDGSQCNTRALKEIANFDGVLFDMTYENSKINLFKEEITTDNVITIFKRHNIPYSFDLLSIDIDSYDFYVLNVILTHFKPRVFVCEYNATHFPSEDKVVLKDNVIMNGNYFGASILAFHKLGMKHDYSLVYANNKGVNLFFVHNDVINSSNYRIKNINNTIKIYRTPKYGKGPNGGHQEDIYNQAYTSAELLLHH
jgi:hypothetical protein